MADRLSGNRRKKQARVLILLFSFLIVVPGAFAHTPLRPSEDNDSLDTALEIPNPTKSWTLYRELHEATEVEYYRLHLHEGEKFIVSVYVPRNSEPDFAPNLIVMGPSIEEIAPAPTTVEVPEGSEATLIKGIKPEAPSYEPFTPASYYFTAEYRTDVTVEGEYYFAVASDQCEGRYGVAVGYVETFTLVEWIMIPLDVIGIRRWEGQSLAFILAPMVLTLALGLSIIYWRLKPSTDVAGILGSLAGLSYVGSGLMMFVQMVMAMIGSTATSSFLLTLMLSILPVIIGVFLLKKLITKDNLWTLKDRTFFALMGMLGFILWAGILVGPTFIILASLILRRRIL